MPPIISVQNLRKTYGKTVAVDDISFEVSKGEIFGFLGPNGAGKTTTVECLQALRNPDSGNISVLGLDPLRQAQELRRRVGSQLQESALPDRIKVWEALDLFASVADDALDWHILLDQWGLAEKRKAGFHSLSGGQKQRLFIALSLVNNPEIVFLDEMTAGLDPAARRVAWDLIRAVRDRGTTVVLVTHFMDEAENLCDRVAIVDKGKIIASDTPRGLIASHATGVRVLFSTDKPDLAFLDKVSGVKNVSRKGDRVEVEGSGPLLALVAAALVEHGIVPADLRVEQPSLEDVFLKVTGHTVGE
ncbi:MAG: multidrug ABC transporter ATP-binding protein [Chloroflexi bacterium RBG_13_51_18]|nr:MAG: multidrug ABC transporter ATP-binding protein [Chloroflexi bacterium RBG_13_51_18]